MKKICVFLLTLVIMFFVGSGGSAVSTLDSKSLERSLENSVNESTAESVELSAISAPSNDGLNVLIKLYMSKSVSSRKFTDFQLREKSHFNVLVGKAFAYRQSEIDLFYKFGLITSENRTSVLYKFQFGCEEYSNMRDCDTKMKIEPVDEVDYVSLYQVEQIQRFVDGKRPDSQRPFIVQIHMDGNTILFYLKGDGGKDFDIAPELNQEMVLRLEEGMIFPNGLRLKETTTFIYNPNTKMWKNVLDVDAEKTIDDTLGNQGGYNDKEIAQVGRG